MINKTDLETALGAYNRKNSTMIANLIFQDLELENEMTSVPDVQDEWVGASFTVGQVLQPWQKRWTEVGQVSATNPGQAAGQIAGASGTGSNVFVARGIKHKVRPIMVNISFDDLNAMERSWLGFLTDESKTKEEWPLVRYLIEALLIPKAKEELDEISAVGDYTAPTDGVPGAYTTATDGILTIINNQIGLGNIAPIATGAFTASDILANVEEFIKAIPAKYRKKGYTLMMSDANLLNLYQNYRDTFKSNPMVYDGKILVMNLLGTNIQVKGFAAFGASNRFVYTAKENMKKLYDKAQVLDFLQVKEILGKLYIYGSFKRGYGFDQYEMVFCNDQE